MSNRSGTNFSAPTDANRQPVLTAASTTDGITPVALEANPTTGALLIETTSTSAGFVSPTNLLRSNISDQTTTITSSTAATTIVTADTTHYLDLVSLVLSNTSSTGTEVTLFNDDGTTARSTFYVPANDTRGIVFTVPFIQTAVNKTWKLKTVTSIASLKVTAQFVLNS